MKIEATIDGVEELQARLHTLAYAGASRASGKAIRAGLKVIERVQRRAVPVDSGRLRRSIGSKFLKRNRQEKGMTTAKSGMNVGRKRPSGKLPQDENAKRSMRYAPHAHLFSLGSRPRWAGIKFKYRRRKGMAAEYVGEQLTGNAVRYAGVMPANPIFRQASKAAEPEAVTKVTTTLLAEIEREAAKAK